MTTALPSTTPASPRAGVIRVLVGALADDCVDVREAASTALKDNARWNSKTILDCCLISLRTVRRRVSQQFSHQARVFHVMAYTVRVMDEEELDAGAMRKIAKLALMEMTSNKDINAVWQKAASELLVAIGSRLPDLMMEEVFLQITGSAVSTASMVQTLADFASCEASQFTPRVKGVFSRVLPLIGVVRDSQRAIFGAAFKHWCWAISQYYDNYPFAPSLDGDTLAFLNSAFDLFLGSWVTARDQKVRLATVEALGELVPFVSDSQRKAALPKLLPVFVNMCKKDKENLLPVTQSLHGLLDAVLRPRSGSPPLLDFHGLQVVLTTLLPHGSPYRKTVANTDGTTILRISNEVLQCFLLIGVTYPEEMFTFLISNLGSKDDLVRLGTLSSFQHLLPRLHGAWDGHQLQLLDAVKPVLSQQDSNTSKALVELIVSMASSGWVQEGSGELFVEFLTRKCAVKEGVYKSKGHESSFHTGAVRKSSPAKTELKLGTASLSELRAMCEKGMLLLAGTMPEMEPVIWPYLLKLIVDADYTEAVGMICKCLCEIAKRKEATFSSLEMNSPLPSDVPKPEEILARMLILLQSPLSRGCPAFQILTAMSHLGCLFPKSMALLWEDEVPKIKSYIDDPEDLQLESWDQTSWDEMIIHLLAESLDVIQNTEWTLSLGNAFSDQYHLYSGHHARASLLHRCLGVLLQRVDNRFYVREKLEVMFRNADVSNATNRMGLAMGFGLVAATHLDTVLEKLKRILESQNRNRFQRFFAIFMDQKNKATVDDTIAALALMYGYAAAYAPSSVLEARLDALLGTNMLSGLLDVHTATAKQAVITAINLLGQSVIKASSQGASVHLKKRDQLLNHTLALMTGDDNSKDIELLQTQILALNACTTLVSVEPKLTIATRDMILQATLNFFALPVEPKHAVESVISGLRKLLRSILLTSGEDGQSKSDQLQHLLKSLDQYVSSPIACQRSRSCSAVLDLVVEFRSLCATGACALGCNGPCMHLKSSTTRVQRGDIEASDTLLLPSRESMNLGERIMIYLPRCADHIPSLPKCCVQIIDTLFSIALVLPGPAGTVEGGNNKQSSYAALSKLEELIAVSRWDSLNQNNDIFLCIVECVGNLLTTQELVVALRSCAAAICDKTHSSAKAMARAVSELIQRRGQDLQDVDVERITHALLSASGLAVDNTIKSGALNAVCSLATHTERKLVFDELLATAEKDITTKDVSRLRGWPVQDAFTALAQNELLSVPFLDYVVTILNQIPTVKDGGEELDAEENFPHAHLLNQLPQAALVAISAYFRKGIVSRHAVQQRYSAILCLFLLQFGTYHTLASVDVQPLRNAIRAFQDFCDCLDDMEMRKVLAKDGDQLLAGEQWTTAIGQIAGSVCDTRQAEVDHICSQFWMVLKRPIDSHREVAAAVLSEYVHHSDADLLKQLVGVLSAQIGDASSVVRRLCAKGLLEIPKEEMPNYTGQTLSVIIALIEDTDEQVSTIVAEGLIMVLEFATEDTVAPILLTLCGRLRTLQLQKNVNIRAAAFGAMGILTRFGSVQRESFIEQVHIALPRVIFHLRDEASAVRQTCKTTLKLLLSYLEMEEELVLTNSRAFNSSLRSDNEKFLKDLTKSLLKHYKERADNYITIAIRNFESPWPEIQSNAAFFTACLLSQLIDHKMMAVHLPQVVGSLVRMAANSQSPVVRASCANSLSILLNSIH